MTVVIMGVAGAGKTTIGTTLARELHWKFVDGDSLHPAANVAKMAAGIPLSDDDRWPWLAAIREIIRANEAGGGNLVVACSALKQSYRDFLEQGTRIVWVYLKGSPEMIRERLVHRPAHFMKSGMLESQLETLEEPREAIVVEVEREPCAVVREIQNQMSKVNE